MKNNISLKILLLLVLGVSCFFSASSQKFPGDVTLKDGTVLNGRIRHYNGLFINNQFGKVTFWQEGSKKKQVFKPREVQRFTIKLDFRTEKYAVLPLLQGTDTVSLIFKEVISGHCSLYERYISLPTGQGMRSAPQAIYYLYRPGELVHSYQFMAMRKGKDPYFSDNEALYNDIQNKRYSASDIEEIVRRYNREYRK